MCFRWDWLNRVVTVPYVPTLGPVHPMAMSPALFEAVVGISGTGRFLPYDKDRRWSNRKDETILVGEISHEPQQTIIPTLSRRAHGAVKIHHLGAAVPDIEAAGESAGKLRAEYGVESGSVVWFQDSPTRLPADTRCSRLLLKVLGEEQQQDPGSVSDLRSCPSEVRSTFAAFTRSLASDGFDFLRERLEAGEVGGPILVTIDEQRIVGAVGPMQIMPDSIGARRLLPQYLGVLPEYRRRGHGRSLWRAAMHWGLVHNAAYQLLQTEVDGTSDRLYLSEGLCSLGFVCAVSI
jgi:hypothetical protein